MRRALLGGIGLALGVFVNTADAQVGRPSAAPSRAAKLGAPQAIPEQPAPEDSGIAPVGLRTRILGTPSPAGPQYPTGIVPGGMAPGGMAPGGIVYGTPITLPGGVPYGSPLPGSIVYGVQPGTPGTVPKGGATIPPPRTSGETPPAVTELRGPTGSNAGVPTTVVPSIVPGATYVGGPPVEAPLYGDVFPGYAATERVNGFGRWYTGAEYLLWWTRSTSLPPLVTTSAPQFNGILGQGNTTSVFSGTFGDTFHSGLRFTAGRWFGDGECRGVEARLFFLDQAESNFTAASTQYPVLARPFFNVNTPYGQYSELVAFPGLAVGGVNVHMENSVWGAELNYRRFLCGNCNARVDAIVGYRFLNMKEELSVTESFTTTSPNRTLVNGVPVVFGTITDTFRAENNFNGGQIGLAGQVNRGRWSIDGRATVAFGNLSQTAEISGGQSLMLANALTANFQGGMLALPNANIGRFTRNQFAVVPEVGVNVGYQLTSRMRLTVGYNFLYLGNALRPEGMIDPNIDAARIPNFPAAGVGPALAIAQPTPRFGLSDFFVQGISFGLMYRW